jgi:hypothetical protein
MTKSSLSPLIPNFRPELDKFLRDFSLSKKLCKRDDGEKCECDQAEKELRGYLKGVKGE